MKLQRLISTLPLAAALVAAPLESVEAAPKQVIFQREPSYKYHAGYITTPNYLGSLYRSDPYKRYYTFNLVGRYTNQQCTGKAWVSFPSNNNEMRLSFDFTGGKNCAKKGKVEHFTLYETEFDKWVN